MSEVPIVETLHPEYSFHLVDERLIARAEDVVDILDNAIDAADAVLRSVFLDRSVP